MREVKVVRHSSRKTLSLRIKRVRSYRKKQLIAMAWFVALKHKLSPSLFIAQIHHESGFNPRALSKAGAIGVGQIMPDTARSWHVNPHDPQAALNAAAKNMASYVHTYKRQGHDQTTAERLALAAYNAGPYAVKKYGGVPPYKETRKYVKVIMANAYD